MCATCGCEDTNHVTISKPPEIKVSGLNVENHHHNHEHDENGHHHQHLHNHTHEKTVIDVEQDILQSNKLLAKRNRGYFEAKNINSFKHSSTK